MTIKAITQIEISIGTRKFSGFPERETAAPTSSAKITMNSGFATWLRT